MKKKLETAFQHTFPLYVLDTQLVHHYERKPTVYERMILRLLTWEQKPADAVLPAIFRDCFGVGDVYDLLQGMMRELVDIGVILHLDRRVDLLSEPLKNLKLTEEGQAFFIKDQLPSRPKSERLFHVFNPITGETSYQTNPNTADAKSAQCSLEKISGGQFLLPNAPEHLVRTEVESASHYPWKKANTIIKSIETQITAAQRKNYDLDIECGVHGELYVSSSDAALKTWLAKQTPAAIWQVCDFDLLLTNNEDMLIDNSDLLGLASFSLQDLQNAKKLALATFAQKTEKKADFVLTQEGVNIDSVVADLPWVLFADGEVVWEEEAKRLWLPKKLTLPVGFRKLEIIEGRVQVEMLGQTTLSWHGKAVDTALILTLNDADSRQIWAKLQADLEQICAECFTPAVHFLPLLWRPDAAAALTEKYFSQEQNLINTLQIWEELFFNMQLWLPDQRFINPTLWDLCQHTLQQAIMRSPRQMSFADLQDMQDIWQNMHKLAAKFNNLSAGKLEILQAALLDHLLPKNQHLLPLVRWIQSLQTHLQEKLDAHEQLFVDALQRALQHSPTSQPIEEVIEICHILSNTLSEGKARNLQLALMIHTLPNDDEFDALLNWIKSVVIAWQAAFKQDKNHKEKQNTLPANIVSFFHQAVSDAIARLPSDLKAKTCIHWLQEMDTIFASGQQSSHHARALQTALLGHVLSAQYTDLAACVSWSKHFMYHWQAREGKHPLEAKGSNPFEEQMHHALKTALSSMSKTWSPSIWQPIFEQSAAILSAGKLLHWQASVLAHLLPDDTDLTTVVAFLRDIRPFLLDKKEGKLAFKLEQDFEKALRTALACSPKQCDFAQILQQLHDIAELLPEKLSRPLQQDLLKHAAPITKVEDADQLQQLNLSLSDDLLSPELIDAWLGRIFAHQKVNWAGLAIRGDLEQIEKAWQKIHSIIGSQTLEKLQNDQHPNVARADCSLKNFDAVELWNKQACPAFARLKIASLHWDKINHAIERWWNLARAQFKADDTAHRFVVVDTNVLMEHANFWNALQNNDKVIIPAPVLEELDKHKNNKNDDQLAKKARDAIRQIEALQPHIEREDFREFLDLKHKNPSKDDLIIATAIFYRFNQHVLLSADKNLCNKARFSYCLETQSPTPKAFSSSIRKK